MNYFQLCGIMSGINLRVKWNLLINERPDLLRRKVTLIEARNLFVAWHEVGEIPVCDTAIEDTDIYPNVINREPQREDKTLTIGDIVLRIERAESGKDRRVHPLYRPKRIRTTLPLDEWYPAYKVGHKKYLLLDGVHRCVSIARLSKRRNIKLIVINGRISREIIPDLACFET